eukprot:Em0110g13a
MKCHTYIPVKTMGDGRVTFAVDSVVGATEPLERVTVRAGRDRASQGACEATFDVTLPLVNADCHDNKFYAAVHTAAGVRATRHAERRKVATPVRSSRGKERASGFDDFSAQIRAAVGDEVYGALTPSFTTTGPRRTCRRPAGRHGYVQGVFFQYRCCTSCGNPGDNPGGNGGGLARSQGQGYGPWYLELTWWTDSLRPVLDQFVEAAAGRVDQKFWSSIYKLVDPGSGGPYITGWIAVLFPYISEQRSKVLDLWKVEKPRRYFGMTSDNVPSGLASTPFVWTYYGTDHAMHFYAGFMAVSQDPKTLALRPEIGWAGRGRQRK